MTSLGQTPSDQVNKNIMQIAILHSGRGMLQEQLFTSYDHDVSNHKKSVIKIKEKEAGDLQEEIRQLIRVITQYGDTQEAMNHFKKAV